MWHDGSAVVFSSRNQSVAAAHGLLLMLLADTAAADADAAADVPAAAIAAVVVADVFWCKRIHIVQS